MPTPEKCHEFLLASPFLANSDHSTSYTIWASEFRQIKRMIEELDSFEPTETTIEKLAHALQSAIYQFIQLYPQLLITNISIDNYYSHELYLQGLELLEKQLPMSTENLSLINGIRTDIATISAITLYYTYQSTPKPTSFAETAEIYQKQIHTLYTKSTGQEPTPQAMSQFIQGRLLSLQKQAREEYNPELEIQLEYVKNRCDAMFLTAKSPATFQAAGQAGSASGKYTYDRRPSDSSGSKSPRPEDGASETSPLLPKGMGLHRRR